MQRPTADDQELRREPVPTVGPDPPARRSGIPLDAGDLRGQARLAVEVVVLGDPTAVGQDLRSACVLLRRHVPRLLEQRQIDVGLDVALRARIPVPVPRTAEIAAFLHDSNAVYAGLLEPGTN